MITVDQALQRVLDGLSPGASETLALADALDRVLAQGVVSQLDLPPFAQSAVDGYAVRHADIAAAPLTLPVFQTIAAAARGQAPVLAPGTAARIFTGGWLPDGADTAVRQEITEKHGDSVRVLRAVEPGTDMRRQGEESRRGDAVAQAGARLTPGLVGAIAMAGLSEVTVRRAPRITVLITGDEVVAPGMALKPGQVPDANGPLLRAYLQSWGHPPPVLRYVRDDFDTVRDSLRQAFPESDLVLTTGGVSVGDHDHIPAAAQACGAHTLLWKVAQKPGMPLFVASHGDCRLFGLPGNPASVLVNLLVYVQPALERLQGLADTAWRRGRLAREVRPEPEKALWLRASLSQDEAGTTRIHPLGGQASHMLSNLARAQALVRVPPADVPWPVDTPLIWKPLSPVIHF